MKVVVAVICFLFLGLFTRFYHLDQPKAVVFDEFHFFHFVTEYEKGKYFFDIHPPLGKLILWGNAKMYGLEEYVDQIEQKENEKKDIDKALISLKDEYITLQKTTNDEEILSEKKAEYERLEAQKQLKDTEVLESYDIGKSYNDSLNIWGIRSIPALFGALLVPLLFLFAWALTRNFWISVLVGVVVAFDSALITESQYVLMDSMLIFFMALGAYAAVRYVQNPTWKWWIVASTSCAFAVSIKWTGASVIAFVGVLWIWSMISNKNWGTSLLKGLFFWILISFVYIASFAIHFSVLPLSGEGDAFHTPEFRKHLQNSQDYNNPDIIPMSFLGRFKELNVQMGERSAGIRNEHPFASRPNDWITGGKSIYYWAGSSEQAPYGIVDSLWNKTIGRFFANSQQCFVNTANFADKSIPMGYEKSTSWQQQIHLFPNPAWWTLFTATHIIALLILFSEIVYRLWYFVQKKETQMPWLPIVIAGMLGMTLSNILPFVFIDRPQFLYHAFEWALFSLLLFALVLSYFMKLLPYKYLWYGIFLGLGLLSLLFFVWEMPLIYGFPFPECISDVLFKGF